MENPRSKFVTWIRRVILSIAILLLVTIAALYTISEIMLQKNFDVALSKIDVPGDSTAIAEGMRLANIFHCSGCHGERLAGKLFFDAPNIARIVAPNISGGIKDYTDQELERLIRHGVNKDRHGVWMPVSTQFYHMSDKDLGKLIAYLRSVPVAETVVNEKTSIRFLGRIGIVTNKFVFPALLIDHQSKRIEKDTASLVLGKYYAKTVCATCHGDDLKGSRDPGNPAPSLITAKAYNRPQFQNLLKYGEGVTRKDLGLMSIMSKYHFSHFTDREIESIHAFLQTIK